MSNLFQPDSLDECSGSEISLLPTPTKVRNSGLTSRTWWLPFAETENLLAKFLGVRVRMCSSAELMMSEFWRELPLLFLSSSTPWTKFIERPRPPVGSTLLYMTGSPCPAFSCLYSWYM